MQKSCYILFHLDINFLNLTQFISQKCKLEFISIDPFLLIFQSGDFKSIHLLMEGVTFKYPSNLSCFTEFDRGFTNAMQIAENYIFEIIYSILYIEGWRENRALKIIELFMVLR